MDSTNNRDIAISVIIPCYNSAATVEETLASLEHNDGVKYEVIVVNDGSTDASQAVLERYAAGSRMQLRIIRQENAGVSAARNRAIEASTGRYVLFLDADDLLTEQVLPLLTETMDTRGTDVMAFLLNRDRTKIERADRSTLRLQETTPEELMERYTYSKRELAFFTFVYRRDILDAHSIRFTVGAKQGEDCEFITKYLAHCKSAVEARNYYTYYRIHPESTCFQASYAQADVVASAERTIAYLDEIGHPFVQKHRDYIYHSALFSVAHRFARLKARDLYARLMREYPLKKTMQFISREKTYGKAARIAALAWLVNPWLYYLIVFK